MANFNILGKTFTDLKGITLPDTTNTDRDFILDGVDEPVFNIIFDGDNGVVSISCNKTYSETYDYINNSTPAATIIHSDQNDPSNIWKDSANFVGIYDSGEIRYVTFSNAVPIADINYFADGTITFTTPSIYKETLTAIKNGTYYPSAGVFSEVTVDVPAPSPTLLNVEQNGTYTAPSGSAYSPVIVNVPQPSGSISITSNGTHDVSDYATANVAVNSVIAVTDEQLPNGGIAKHITAIDIGDTTAVASDVAAGKYFYTASGVKTAGTSSGGGGEGQLIFIDYDGTVVRSYSKSEALALSALPPNPSHTGLTAQGWNWSLANIQSYMTKYPDAIVNVGQMYITDDEKTRLYVHFEEERKSPWLQLYPNGTVVIDWGDNTATDTLTGTSLTTIKSVQHTYAHGGDYVITLVVTGTARIEGNGSSGSGSYLLQKEAGKNSSYVSKVYRNSVRKIEFGSGIELYGSALKELQSLETVILPKYMTSIGGSTFNNCYSLVSLTIPDGITGIGANTFQYCYSLASLTIPDGVTSIGAYAFQYCYSLASLTIPDGVTSIEAYAFSGCCSLASFTIPDGVTSIKSNTFNGCYSLASLTIPDGVTSIGTYAFYSCYSLASLTIPDGVTSIGDNAFRYCCSIVNLTIPDGVTRIENYAFHSCYSLASFTIPDGVTSIGSYAFQHCYSLASLTIPDGVTSIGAYAFYNCYSLASLTIPDGVTSIGVSAFYNCYSLASLTIPDGVTSIGTYAFYNCYSLVSLTIPDGVTGIGANTFYGCYSLASLTIPDGVTSIGTNAFQYCYGMAEYHFLSEAPPTLVNTNAFVNIPSDCIIYVPTGSLEAYQTASNWSTYASYMQEESG